jgi:DNA-binding transcriptional ArsR family regulator
MLDHQESPDRLFHALAEPNRRAMIERLTRGPASVKELAEPLPMSLAAALQHLQVLENSGVIRTEKVGRVRTCQLEPAGLRLAEEWLRRQRTAWERRLDRLGQVLDDEND